jgi:hypothetical protein
VPDPVSREDIEDWIDEDFVLPDLTAADEQRIGSGSIDVIAFYVSFHMSRLWGIFVWEDRLLAYAKMLLGPLAVTDRQRLLRTWDFVSRHEFLHYWTDIAATHMEIASRSPIYLPYLHAHGRHSDPVAQLEEAVATSRAWRGLTAIERAAAEPAMLAAPAGYRDWYMYTSHLAYRMSRRELGEHIAASVPPARPLFQQPYEWFFEERRAGAGERTVPMYLLRSPAGKPGIPYVAPHARPITILTSRRFDKSFAV